MKDARGPAPTPIHFGPGRSLFGWVHAGRDDRAVGVVLCNPLGDELTRAHRPLRHLAQRLAGAGFAVLRFDFHGTGDSAGDEREPGRVRTWLGDVRAAVDELRARGGVRAVALVGLRAGATLAMAAAAGAGGVDSLVLWDAFVSGGAFAAESLKLEQVYRLLERTRSPEPEHAGGREALGFFLTDETHRDLAALDLLAIRARPAVRALVVGAGAAPAEAPLVAHLEGLGTEVAYCHLPGHTFLSASNHLAHLPEAVLASVVAWLDEAHPVAAKGAGAGLGPRAAAPVAAEALEPSPGEAAERPLAFGARHRMIGVLSTREVAPGAAPRPAIVLVNAGTVHRIGPHRQYVGLARRWTALGFPVLRVDLSGIGDSVAPAGRDENLCYPATAVEDAQDAMDLVRAETGAERFVLMGLCSGADIAFQTGLVDPRVVGVVMMNPRTFLLNDLGAVNAYEQARYTQGSLLRKESWKKALRGDVDLGRAVATVFPRVKGVALDAARQVLVPAALRGPSDVEEVPRRLRSLAERGVDTFLLVARHDPGVDYLDARCGKELEALSSVPGFRRETLEGTDHTFSSVRSQARVSELVTEHLTRTWPEG